MTTRSRSPSSALVVAGRRVRLGQVDVRAASTSSRPRSSRPTSAAGSCRDDENDQAATDGAFEVLHFIAAKRLEARPAHGGRRDQRPAPRPASRWSSWRASITSCRSRSSSTCRREVCHERNARAPGPRTSARTSSATSTQQLRRSLSGLTARASGACFVLRRREEIEAATSSASRSGPTGATSTVRSTSSATSTAASTSSWRCSTALGYADRAPTAPDARAPRRPHGGLPRRPRRPRPADPRRAAARDGRWSTTASALCVPGNHENKLHARSSRPQRPDQPRSRGVARAARTRSRPSSATRSRRSSTGSSATTCSTTAGSSSRTPG